MATRYSWFLTSRGMPTFTLVRLLFDPFARRRACSRQARPAGAKDGAKSWRAPLFSRARCATKGDEEGQDVPEIDSSRDEGLDALDRDILRELQADGRLTNVELAKRVRLSPSPCLRRVQSPEDRRHIRGDHALPDPGRRGRPPHVAATVRL